MLLSHLPTQEDISGSLTLTYNMCNSWFSNWELQCHLGHRCNAHEEGPIRTCGFGPLRSIDAIPRLYSSLPRFSQWPHSKFWAHTLGRLHPIDIFVFGRCHLSIGMVATQPSLLHRYINTLPCQNAWHDGASSEDRCLHILLSLIYILLATVGHYGNTHNLGLKCWTRY